MKIGIITFSCALNYGAMLQTYGLYSKIREKGHDPIIIDYFTERYNIDNPNYPDEFVKHTRVWKINKLTKYLWKRLKYEDMKRCQSVFRSFLRDKCDITHKYYSNDELINDPPRCEIFITGSDQVWNPDYLWTGIIDLPYYLAFVNESRLKLSYASSFGKNGLTQDELNQASIYLKQYEAISVREDSAKEILHSIGINAEVVCDPTVLCDEEEWNKLATNVKEPPYLLLFLINWDKDVFSETKRMCKQLGLKLIYICPSFDNRIIIGKRAIYVPSVYDWLGYFMNAKYVVTDSFHGTVFSTIYKKLFISIIGEYSSRIKSYLGRLELSNRAVEKGLLNIDLLKCKIDYNRIDILRKEFQNQSMRWLERMINSTSKL